MNYNYDPDSVISDSEYYERYGEDPAELRWQESHSFCKYGKCCDMGNCEYGDGFCEEDDECDSCTFEYEEE